MGTSIWQILILIGFVLFVWFSIKVARHSFKFLKKSSKESIADQSDHDEHLVDFDINDFKFVMDNLLNEKEIISTEEIIPLDNRHGTSPIVSEHEFSRTVNNSFQLNKVQDLDGRVKTSLWTLIETEIKKKLTKSIGFEFGEQITRRVTVKLEAPPGQFVKYKLCWKQKQREGTALVSIQNKEIQIPYTTTYGLFHSVESVEN